MINSNEAKLIRQDMGDSGTTCPMQEKQLPTQ